MCKHAGLYIAYGSNMNIEQMARRCPTAKVVSSGWLEGYRLRFKGGSYGSVATVEPSPDDLVPILIWELKPQDEANLDLYEGYPRLPGHDLHHERGAVPLRISVTVIL